MHKPLEFLSKLAVAASVRAQRKRGVPDLAQWSLDNVDGELAIGGLKAGQLLAEFGSPLFVLNEARLRADIQEVQNAFSAAPAGSKILYSYKTNATPGIVRLVHECGAGAEVISPQELSLALHLSVPPQNLAYNGTSKTEDSLRQAIAAGLFSINADSLSELQLLRRLSQEVGRPVAVGLRLGLAENTQFGVDLDSGEAREAARFIAEHAGNFNWTVVHAHTVANSQRFADLRPFVLQALQFLKMVQSTLGVDVPYLDVGGGFGIPTVSVMSRREYAWYRMFAAPPRGPEAGHCESPERYFGQLFKTVEQFCAEHRMPHPKLIIEPGRLLVSRSELLLSRVNDVKVKSTGRRFAMTDIGRHSTAYPCDYEHHEILAANKLDRPLAGTYQLVGRICTSADVVVRNKQLAELQAGDSIAVLDAGAYFHSYSSNFAFPRPAVVKVSNGKATLLHSAETFEHSIAMDSGE